MGEQIIKQMDVKRFDALVTHSRSPAAAYFCEEIAWFSNEEETVLGVLVRDKSDIDFSGIILGRDEAGRFRCFDQEVSIQTEAEARAWIDRAIKWHSRDSVTQFPQGDYTKPIDLFTPIVPPAKFHPGFVALLRDESFVPARKIISEIMPHYVDVDGNFVEQFQTTGFDARVWELYLNSYLTEEQLFIIREFDRPDFLVKKYGKSVAIEATIVGRSKDNPPSLFKNSTSLPQADEVRRLQENELPIKFGSPLYSKLKKKYWELDHVKNLPLVFAIADFHDDQSMLWSSTALINYLYGVRHGHHFDENGKLVIDPIKIETHKVGDKEIPSGFFFQPGAEYVSAVMFSASGTISKFNRMGRQAGFTAPGVIMMRVGTHHDHDPNANLPKPFSYFVSESSNETWAEGLSMFHNPNSIYPVPEELFPSIAHHRFEEGQIVSLLPEFHPYASQTIHMKMGR